MCGEEVPPARGQLSLRVDDAGKETAAAADGVKRPLGPEADRLL